MAIPPGINFSASNEGDNKNSADWVKLINSISSLSDSVNTLSKGQQKLLSQITKGFSNLNKSYTKASSDQANASKNSSDSAKKEKITKQQKEVLSKMDKQIKDMDDYIKSTNALIEAHKENSESLKSFAKVTGSKEYRSGASSIATEYGENLRKHTDKNLGKSIYSLFAKEFPIIQAITKKYASGPGGIDEQLQDERDSLKKSARLQYKNHKSSAFGKHVLGEEEYSKLETTQDLRKKLLEDKRTGADKKNNKKASSQNGSLSPEASLTQKSKPNPTREDIASLPAIYGSGFLYLGDKFQELEKKAEEDEQENGGEGGSKKGGMLGGVLKKLFSSKLGAAIGIGAGVAIAADAGINALKSLASDNHDGLDFSSGGLLKKAPGGPDAYIFKQTPNSPEVPISLSAQNKRALVNHATQVNPNLTKGLQYGGGNDTDSEVLNKIMSSAGGGFATFDTGGVVSGGMQTHSNINAQPGTLVLSPQESIGFKSNLNQAVQALANPSSKGASTEELENLFQELIDVQSELLEEIKNRKPEKVDKPKVEEKKDMSFLKRTTNPPGYH